MECLVPKSMNGLKIQDYCLLASQKLENSSPLFSHEGRLELPSDSLEALRPEYASEASALTFT